MISRENKAEWKDRKKVLWQTELMSQVWPEAALHISRLDK